MAIPEILFVANQKLPEEDYRTEFALRCKKWKILLGLPGRPENVPEDQFIQMGFREGVSIRETFAFLRLLLYLLRNRSRLGAVHYFHAKNIFIGPVLSLLAGVPSIVTVTGLGRVFSEDDKLRYRLLRPLYRFLMRLCGLCAEKILFQNRGDMEFVKGWLKWTRSPPEYVGSAMNVRFSGSREYDRIPLNVLLVSRLLSSKGIADFMDIAQALRGDDFRFILVGPRSWREDGLLEEVVRKSSEGVIEYRGELHGEGLYGAYREAQVFLFTSYYGEGMARVMLEAGLAGLCPVAYDISANRDLIDAGRGFLVPLRDRGRATEVLRTLLRDRETLQSNALAFQEFVFENYSLEKYEERLNRVLESVLKCSPSEISA